MSNDFNASLVISTSEAVANVRAVDGAAKDLDKTLAHLHTTMQNTQGDLDKVAGSLKVFTATQRQANKDQKDRNATLISEAKLEREQIVNKGKVAEQTTKQAMAEAKLQGVRARNGRASVSGLGNETRRNQESAARVAGTNALATQRLATESERLEGQTHRTAAALAARSSAEARGEITALRLAAAQERARNANLALNDSLSNSRYLLYDVGQTYATLSAILLALPAATTAVAAAYEKDFTQVMRTTGLVGDEAKELFQEMKELGREIPLTFSEFSNIASIAGQLGIAKDEIGAFTETVAKFGAASNVGISEAATAFGRLENSFNQDGSIPDFYNRVGSAIAKVGVESAASETEIIAVTNQISAAGSQFGFAADEIVGLSGALASVRIRPELARGAFQRIMLQLSRAADEGADSFNQFAKYTGVAGDAAIELFKTDPSTFFQKYIAGLKGTIDSGASVSSVLDDIGAKNVFDKQFILGLANGLNVYNKAMADSSTAFEKGSFLNESTKATFETFAATIKKIGTALSGLAASLGGGSLAPLTAMAETVLNVVTSFDRLLTQQPAISAIINGLLAFGGVVGVFLAFKSAQAFVLAGLVGLQQVMGKASIAGALSLKGNISELAKTMLMSKGASASMAQSLLQNKTAMQQLAFATASTSASLARYATVSSTAAAGSGQLASRTAVAASGLRTFGTGLLSVVGGPLGALTLGLGAVVTSLIATEEQANQAGDAIARAMKNGGDAGNRAIAESLVDREVGLLDPIAMGNVGKDVAELAREVDVSFDAIVASVAKGKESGKAFLGVMNALGQSRGGQNFADAIQRGLISGDEGAKLEFILSRVVELGDKSAKSASGIKATDEAVESLAQGANAAAPSVDGLETGLEGVGDKAEDTASKIGDAVDAVFGLANAGMATQESLGKLGESIFESQSLNTTDAGGRANVGNIQEVLRNAALEQQALIDSGQQTAQQAAVNYTTFIDGLLQNLAAKGLDVSQVQALADQAKGVFASTMASGAQPTMQVKVDTSKVDDARNYLDHIVAKYGTTNLSVILREGGSEQVTKNVFAMQQYIEAATGDPYVANIESDSVQAINGITETVQWGYSVFGTPFTATIDANADPFTQVMSFVAQQAATVINGIIDGINTVRNFGNGLFGQTVENIGHVGWGEVQAAPKREAPAVPTLPTMPKAPSGSSSQPEIERNNANMASLGGLENAYQDAGDAAQEAGEKGKKAGEDAANGIDDATEAAEDYGNRLRQGLQSVFDKQYGVQTALDAYYTTLNSIKKKREEEIAQVADLLAKQKELNNSRKEDLITARKAGIEKAISLKYGEGDRAADYGNQEQTALDSAAAKQKDIDATKRQAAEIQAGIGKLTGYSQAAIDNRSALRDLEGKMLDVIGAYGRTGMTVDQVKAKARALTAQFKADVAQLGYNRGQVRGLGGDLNNYLIKVGQIPRTKPTTVSASTGAANAAVDGIKRNLASIPRNTTATVTTRKVTEQYYVGHLEPTGNKTANGQPTYRVIRPDGTRTNNIAWNKGGIVPGFASGGLIPGRPPTDPSVDNRMAQVDGKGQIMVRSGEYIVQEPAVKYWGLDFFKNLNNMKMPAFNAGGSVGGGRSSSGSSGPMLVELTAENIAAIQRLPQVNLFTENRLIAQSANDGNAILATQGAN